MTKAKKGGAQAAKKNSASNGVTAMPLGGLGEIGLNCMAYECDGEMVLVDVGITFNDDAAPGADVVIPDLRYVRERAKRLKAIVITHAHEDHIGALPYVWDELPAGVPVYVSPYSERVLRHKMKEFGFDEKEYAHRLVSYDSNTVVKVGENFTIEFVSLTHSILEMYSVVLRTPYGNLVHTGDFKLDRNPSFGEQSDIEKLKALGEEGVLAAMVDSTNIFVEGRSGSEGDLLDSLDNVFAGIKGKLIFGTFSSNAGRLIKVVELAAKHGRKTAILSKSAINNYQHAKACGYVPPHVAAEVIDAEQASNMAGSDVMLLVAGTQGEPNSALGGLSRGQTVRGHKLNKNDTVLLSSRFIPGNERAIYNMINLLTEQGAKVLVARGDNLHVSGHAGREELAELYKLLKPEIVLPVHGEYSHMNEHAAYAKSLGVPNTFVIKNGTKIYFGPDKPQIMEKEKPPFGRCYVDGMNILDADKWVLKDRRKMAFDGVVSVALPVSETGQLLGMPAINSRGLIDADLQPEMYGEISEKVERAIEKFSSAGLSTDDKALHDTIENVIKREFRAARGKKPVVMINLVQVEV